MPATGPLLSVSLRLSDELVRPWRVTVDPLRGRPDLQPEVPWCQVRPGHRVVFEAGSIYEVERIARVTDPAAAPLG